MSTTLAKIDDRQDKLMGEQLTAEFKEAVNGMWRTIRVGGMVAVLREKVLSNLDKTASRGPSAKGKGLDSWLEKYAPEVNRATAYRFEDVFKAVKKSYELPARVAKQLTFEQIVTAEVKDLNEAAKKVRMGIHGFVAGTSQKSWLDQFREAKPRGGDTSQSGNGKHDPNEERNAFLESAKNDFCKVFDSLDRLHDKELWKAPSITDAMLDQAVESASDFAKKARAWLKVPRRERTKIDIEELAK